MEWFFWMLFGIVIGVAATFLVQELNKRGIRFVWYEWIPALLSVVFLIGAVQNFTGSLAEGRVQAAWLMLVSLLVPTAVFAALTARLVRARLQ